MGEQGIAGSQVTHDGAAEISGEKNGAEDRRCRHRVKQGAKQQEGSDRKVQLDRNSQVRESIHDRLGLEKFHDAVENEQEHDYGADRAPCPECFL